MSITGNLTGEPAHWSGEIVWNFEFSDFAAEFKQSFDQGAVRYFLNEEEIGRGAFEEFLSRGSDPFIYSSNLSRVR